VPVIFLNDGAMELYYLTMKKYREASPEGAQIEIQEEKTEQ